MVTTVKMSIFVSTDDSKITVDGPEVTSKVMHHNDMHEKIEGRISGNSDNLKDFSIGHPTRRGTEKWKGSESKRTRAST